MIENRKHKQEKNYWVRKEKVVMYDGIVVFIIKLSNFFFYKDYKTTINETFIITWSLLLCGVSGFLKTKVI